MALLSLRRAIAPVSAVLALALAFTGLTVAVSPAPPAAAEGVGQPFDCSDPRYFAMVGGSTSQLYTGRYVTPGQDPWTALGSAGPNYNALAFNKTDNFLYGVGSTGTLYRIDSAGQATSLGASGIGSPQSILWDSGVIIGDTYYVANRYNGASSSATNTTIHRIHNLSAGPRTTDTISIPGKLQFADLTEKNGYLWAVNYNQNGSIYRIDLSTGTATTFENTPLSAGAYGSAFTMTNGNLAFIDASTMYQVSVTNPDGPATGTGAVEFALVGTVAARTNSQSDAANCASALISSLSVEKVGPPRVQVGSEITWTITVTNDGPGVTSGYVLTDLLPAGVSDVSIASDDADCTVASAVITCYGGTLSPTLGANTHVLTVTATAPQSAGAIVNSVRVVGNEDPEPDDPSTADTDVVLATVTGQSTTLPASGVSAYNSISSQGGAVSYENGAFTYTPPTGFSGSDEFTYSTPSGNVTVYILVSPIAAPDATTTPVNVPVSVAVSDLVDNGTGTGLSYLSAGNPVNGTLSEDPVTGDVVFTPTLNFSGTGTFDYTLEDAAGSTATETVTVTVTPTAGPVSTSTATNTTVTVPIAILTGAGVGTDLELVSVGSPTNGTVSLVAGGAAFVPAEDFSGTGTFAYTVRDAEGRPASGTVTVAVSPAAANDSATTWAETSVAIDVLANDNGTGLEITDVSTPSSGSVALNDDGDGLVYTPADGFSGTATFTYEVTDAANSSSTATVTVAVTPVAADAALTTPAETLVSIPLAELVADSTGTGLYLTSITSVTHGAMEYSGGAFRFTPDDGFSGTGSFDYTLRDASGQASVGTVTITVTPAASGSTASTAADTAVTVTSETLEGTGTGTGLELTAAGGAVNGSVAIVDGDCVFTPAADFSGTGTFAYTLTDDEGLTVTETVTITVAPGAGDDSQTTAIDTAADFSVLTNDVGVNLTTAKLTDPANGSVTLAADGSATYTPNAGYSGLDSFTYTLSGDGGTDTATVRILVTPLAPDDSAVTDAGRAVAIDVLANDGGAGLEIIAVGATTAGGTVTYTVTGLTYTPTAGFSGSDSFTYTVEDAQGTTAQATVTVLVLPLAAPTASNGDAGKPITIDVSGKGTGTGLVVTSVVAPANGTAVLNSDGTITFTPRTGFSGVETIEYTFTDADGLTVVGTVEVTVLPTAAADSVRTVAGEPITISTLANDLGRGLHIVSTTSPSHGTVAINADGTITYTPSAGFAGSDTFAYTVADAAGSTVTATVTVLVTPSLQVTGTESGSLAIAALVLLGLGGLGVLAHLRRPPVARHRS